MTALASPPARMTSLLGKPRRRFWIGLGITLLIIMLILLPLRLALSMANLTDSRFSAFHVSGSVWGGRMLQAQVGPFALSDVDAGLRFFPLFLGRMEFQLERGPLAGDSGLNATIGQRGDTLMLSHSTATLVPGDAFAPLPISRIELADFSVGFTGDRCTNASGMVRMALATNLPGLAATPVLAGQAKCEDGALLLPLKSAGGTEELIITIDGKGEYGARLRLTGGDERWSMLLPPMGFRAVPGGYVLGIDGNLTAN